VYVLQHGTLCHCDGSRAEQWKEAGGGKQESMNVRTTGDGVKRVAFLSVHELAYVHLL